MDFCDVLKYASIYEALAKKKKKKKRTEKSMKKQYETMTKGKEHPFKHMVEKFKKHPEIEDPEGLAAKLKDVGKGTTKWRGKDKKKKKDK